MMLIYSDRFSLLFFCISRDFFFSCSLSLRLCNCFLPSWFMFLKWLTKTQQDSRSFLWQCDALDSCCTFDGLNQYWIYSFFFKSKESDSDSVTQNCWGWKGCWEVIWSNPVVSVCKPVRLLTDQLGQLFVQCLSRAVSVQVNKMLLLASRHTLINLMSLFCKNRDFFFLDEEIFSKEQSWYRSFSVNSKWK